MLKRTALTAGYYIISFTLLFLLNDASPSGPCIPGMAFFGFLTMVPLSIKLLLRNIFVTTKIGKVTLPATGIHAGACMLVISPSIFN